MNTRTYKTLALTFAVTTFALVCAPYARSAQVEAAYMTATRYDIAGRVIGTIGPDPDGGASLRLLATRNTYTGPLLTRVESGELTSFPSETVDASSWGSYGFTVFLTKEFGYDSYGRRITEAVKGTDGTTIESLVQYSYDAAGHIQCMAIRMNKAAFGSLPASACSLGTEGTQGPDRISRFAYDALDQIFTEERAVGSPLAETYVTNAYFPATRLLQFQTDANGNKTELQYDSYGRVKKRIYPHPTSIGSVNANDYNQYDYDENGNLKWERERNGTTISTNFDATNLPIFKNLSDNTYSQDIVYDYDLRGLVLSMQFATEAGVSTGVGIVNSYDGFERIASTTSNVGGFSRALTYLYDNNGNRTRVTLPDGNFFQYNFDGLNRVGGVAENSNPSMLAVTYRPNGQRWTINRAGGVTTTFTPDNARRLKNFSHDFAGTADDFTNSFSYNPANQIAQLVQSNSIYSYTGNQNRTGTYAPNGLNQYSAILGQSLSYDVNGNLTNDGAGSTFTYDMENRLVSTTGPTATFKYDPLGRLIEYTPPSPGATTQFLYDGNALIAEYTIGGNTATQTRRYVHGDQVDEPWVQYNVDSGNARRFLYSDHQGSIIAQSDSAAVVTARLSYDNYGIPGSGNIDRFGYTGQTWLKEIGLNYYKARMYSPKLGRFLQTDPVGYKDDLNLYSYVANNPLNAVDPSGNDAVECIASNGGGTSDIACTITVQAQSETTHLVVKFPMYAFDEFQGFYSSNFDYKGTTNDKNTLSQINHQLSNFCGCEADLDPSKAEEPPGIEDAFDAIAMLATMYDGHHPWPKYLGGPFKQKLTRLPRELHQEFHRGLDEILSRRRRASHYEALSPSARLAMYRKLANYTKAFDAKCGTDLYNDLLKNGFPKL